MRLTQLVPKYIKRNDTLAGFLGKEGEQKREGKKGKRAEGGETDTPGSSSKLS